MEFHYNNDILFWYKIIITRGGLEFKSENEVRVGKKSSTSIEKKVIPSESETDFKEEKSQVKCDYCNATKSVDREFEHFNGSFIWLSSVLDDRHYLMFLLKRIIEIVSKKKESLNISSMTSELLWYLGDADLSPCFSFISSRMWHALIAEQQIFNKRTPGKTCRGKN